MWAFYALLSAFFAASIDPVAKIALRKSDAYIVGWFGLLFSIPFLAISFFTSKIPVLTPELFRIMAIAMPFEILAVIFYYKALRTSDISITVPFLALTPIFSAFFAYILMGEILSRQGMVGVCLISIGVYSLNIKEAKYSLLHPLKAIFTNKGSLYMAFVGFLYGVGAVFSKMAMLQMTPETIAFVYMSAVAVCLTPIVLYRMRMGLSKIEKGRDAYLRFALIGILFALACSTYFKSVSMTNIAYTISIKRLSLLMSVGYGWFIFKERDIRIRFLSTLCMCIGIFLIFMATE